MDAERAPGADRVLGSPVERACDDERSRTILVSDLHVPMEGGAVLGRLRTLLQEASRGASHTRLLVLGDLFEYLVGPRHLAVGAYREVVQGLAEAARAGLSITVLQGNRDFMLDETFARRAGARVVAGGLRLRLGGRVGLALHGDELCLADLPYQRSKRLLRSRAVRAALRALPLPAALWLGRRARAASMRSIGRGNPARFMPPEAAVREALREADVLVFGHIHRPGRGVLEGAGEYCVLPAFDETGVCLEHRDGELRYRDASGRIVPDFPPHAFPGGAATISPDA